MLYLVPENGDLPWETSPINHFDVQCGKFLEVIWSKCIQIQGLMKTSQTTRLCPKKACLGYSMILESMTCEYILRIFVQHIDMNDLHLCMVRVAFPRLPKKLIAPWEKPLMSRYKTDETWSSPDLQLLAGYMLPGSCNKKSSETASCGAISFPALKSTPQKNLWTVTYLPGHWQPPK